MTKTCFIIGNGVSFNRAPLNLLETEPTFGMNYAGFQPKYYICVDTDVLIDNADKISNLVRGADMAFLSKYHAGANALYTGDNVILVDKDKRAFREERFMSGFTAAYVALKCAYYMGFEEVHLYGIDHSPTWAHYRDDYPAGDVDHRAERMSVMEWHYKLAAKVYNSDGRRIVNHSNPSNLDAIFER